MLRGRRYAPSAARQERHCVLESEYHGIRLDVYAKDENNTRYSIEMQVRTTPVEKRSRYYHSQIDMDLLLKGAPYEQLPDVYVIFICDYDPFGERKYCYTVDSVNRETQKSYEDGNHTLFLNTVGENKDDVAPELARFLDFVHADLASSTDDFGDAYVKQLQASVKDVKASREMEGRFMVLEEMLRQEHRDGYEEGLQEGLQTLREIIMDQLKKLGEPSSDIQYLLEEENKKEVLKKYFQMAQEAVSLEEFEQKLKE